MRNNVNINNEAWESYYNSALRGMEFESYRNQDEKHPYIKRLLKYSHGRARSLEFGSGKGGLSLALKKDRSGIETHLLDFSQPAVQYSQDLFKYYGLDGKFHCGSLSRLPYPDGYFDFIHGNTVLEHIEDTEKVVKELLRVLSSGGLGVITVPNSRRRFDGHDLYHFINDIQYYSRTFYPEELENLFKNNSCDIVDRFGYTAVYFYPSYPLQYMYKLLQKIFIGKKETIESASSCDCSIPVNADANFKKISIFRRIMRAWGYCQRKLNLYMEHHEILPYPWWIIIGVVIKKR